MTVPHGLLHSARDRSSEDDALLGDMTMAHIRLGVNNCFAVKRWVEPEEWTRICRELLGVDWVQVSLDVMDTDVDPAAWRSIARRVRRACDQYRISIHSVFGGLISYSYNGLMHPNPAYRAQRMRWLCQAIEKSAEVGAESFGGPLGALTALDFAQERRRAYMREVLLEQMTELSEVAGAAGLKSLLWEPTPLPRELCHTTAEAQALICDANDRIRSGDVPWRLNLDTGHQCSPDLDGDERDPMFHLEQLLPLAEVVHVQQTDGAYDRHWPFTPEFNGKGIIDADEVARRLKFVEHDVYVMLEVVHAFEESDEQVLDDMAVSVEHWRRSLSA